MRLAVSPRAQTQAALQAAMKRARPTNGSQRPRRRGLRGGAVSGKDIGTLIAARRDVGRALGLRLWLADVAAGFPVPGTGRRDPSGPPAGLLHLFGPSPGD